MPSELDLNDPTDREGIVLSRYYITLLTKGNKDMWFISSCERKMGTKHPSKCDLLEVLHWKVHFVDCNVDGE